MSDEDPRMPPPPADLVKKKGYQPQRVVTPATPKPQGGYTPLTGEGTPTNPPNEGTSGKK